MAKPRICNPSRPSPNTTMRVAATMASLNPSMRIAEQLADFRGEVWPGGRRDYLLRHLDRVDVISQHLPAVAKYIRMVADRGIESHLVFKNPVPMEFALKHMAERVSVGIFDRLATI